MTSTTTSIALPWVVILSIMCFCSLVGNIVVVIVIIHDRLLKGPNYTLALVCNMALSDALYVGLAIPLILVSAFTKENWILGNVGCKLMMFLPNFCIASSIYTMVVIAFDRRVTILTNQPRVHRDGSMYLALLLVWLFSAAVAAPAFYEYSVYQRSSFFLSDRYAGSSSEEVDDDVVANNTDFYLACGSHDIVASFEKIYAIILFIVAYILPLMIISINYVIIVKFFIKRRSVAPIPPAVSSTADKGKQPQDGNIPVQLSITSMFSPSQDISTGHFQGAGVHQQENHSTCSKASHAGTGNNQGLQGTVRAWDKPKTFVQKVTTRVIKMLLILVVMFAISWAPYFILFVREEVTGADDTARFGEVFHVVKLIASVTTSLLNPLVYAVFNARIRKGITNLVCPNGTFLKIIAPSPSGSET